MFCVSPMVAATEEEARAEVERLDSDRHYVEKQLVRISSNTEIDFKQFDWDEPLPADLTTNGERGSLEYFMRGDGSPGPKTLRQLALDWATTGIEFVGTPEQVAREMGEAMEEIGGDGFLIMKPGWDLNRKYITTSATAWCPSCSVAV